MPLALTVLSRVLPVVLWVRAGYRRLTRPIKIGVRALVVHDNQVLLIRQHGQAFWILPGGAAERGESLRTSAVREVREETGWTVEAVRLLGIYSCMHEGMTLHTVVYVCRPVTQAQLKLNIEVAEARFWPIDALPATEGMIEQRLAEYAADLFGVDEGF